MRHRTIKEGRASCVICKRIICVSLDFRSGGFYNHYQDKHKHEFDLIYNPFNGYKPKNGKIGFKGELRCNVSPSLKKTYETLDEAWNEVFLAAALRNVILYPYKCMGYWKGTYRQRGCHKWHVSRKHSILNP